MTWTGDAYNPDEDAEHERELKQHGMEPDADKYEGHLASEGQTWAWSKWMLNNAETIEQHEATSALLNDAPLLLAEVLRLREENKKQNNVLTTLDEMIHRSEEHVEMMKALEQGLGLPETWKEMIE